MNSNCTFLVITVYHVRDLKQFHWKWHLLVTANGFEDAWNECCPGNLKHSITMVTNIAFRTQAIITLHCQEKNRRNGLIKG